MTPFLKHRSEVFIINSWSFFISIFFKKQIVTFYSFDFYGILIVMNGSERK